MNLDKQRIALDLEKYSEVFYHFWNYCDVEFTEHIPTAAVSFDKAGKCLKLSINPKFWEAKTYTQQLFIICHEFLHGYYKHGNKVKNLIKEGRSDLMQIANVAMDLCVNRNLTTSFGFDRTEIDPENMFCWIDTVFKDRPENPDRYFEYYYNLIKDNAKVVKIATGKSGGNNLVDDHSGLGEMEDDEIDGILKEIAGKAHPEEIKRFLAGVNESEEDKKSKKAGNQSGSQILKVRANHKIKRRWEGVIKRWTQKAAGDGDFDQWGRSNRRMTFLGGDLLLPSENQTYYKDFERIDILMALDSSGSCSHLAQRFFDVSNSIDRNKFNITTICFDTNYYLVERDELKGFEGTDIQAVQNFITNELIKKNKKEPSAIFVVTDGYGIGKPKCTHPENWKFFLSENYTACIPRESETYFLSDFE